MDSYPGMFKNRYGKLQGRNWVRSLDPEDKEVFISLGLSAAEYGHLGGVARAQTAKRDDLGRFVPKVTSCTQKT
jgi:hypothetical protein